MILVLKLVTGEEIVGDVTMDSDCIVKNPCMIQLVPSRSNSEQAAMALVPVGLHLEEHSITVKQEHIVWTAKPVKDLYNQFNSYFGSGIQLAGL